MTALGETLQFLRSRGFTRTATAHPQTRAFEGSLRVSAGEVPIRLEIEDWDFLSYPRIALRGYPVFLPSPLPHLDSSGGLCYLARGSVVLDRFQPAGAIALCLDEAAALLERIIINPGRRRAELQDEFLAYWAAGSRSAVALIGQLEPHSSAADCYAVHLPPERLDGARVLVIGSRPSEVEHLRQGVSAQGPARPVGRCMVFRCDRRPVAPDGNLPSTVGEVFRYLRGWDEPLSRAIQHRLGEDREYLKFTHAIVAIHSPSGWLGFYFELNPVFRKGFVRKPQAYRQHLHGRGSGTAIARLSLREFGTDFPNTRSLQSPTLAGKRVHLVGGGSVGGYVAQSLARLGAGAGVGTLSLIDSEDLEPENVGRHWLGMSSLFLPKAHAIAAELARHFPESDFTSQVADAREVRGLFDADLVIDATGIEPLSEVLNAKHCGARSANAPPVLYVWVLGNGEAVQGLWVDSPKFGCYRCLRLPRGAQYRQERFPVLQSEPTVRTAGCGEYRPYAVSAPMSAAALAIEFVVDWLNGDPSPRFRTLAREGAALRKQRNQNFAPVQGCPACQRS